MAMNWRRLLPNWLARSTGLTPPAVPAALWQATVAARPFLQLPPAQDAHLQALVAHFLQSKEFSGAAGLQVSDAMAVDIAAQACLLLLHWGTPAQALRWYGDFVGIVVYPGDVRVRRHSVDEAGVAHFYDEVILGEAMEGGPVVLSWAAVQTSLQPPSEEGAEAGLASNVVIHEFAHKIDMRNGDAEGCPPLPPGFMGTTSARAAREAWRRAWSAAYEHFQDQVTLAQRFGAPSPWLDSYGAEAPEEFFAVACEAFFVDRPRFAQEFPELALQLQALFEPGLAPELSHLSKQ